MQKQKMYQKMGGESLEDDVATILNELQASLNNVIDELAMMFAKRFESFFVYYHIYYYFFIFYYYLFFIYLFYILFLSYILLFLIYKI